MKELRLLPAAVITWLVVGLTVVTRSPWLGAGLAVLAALSAVKWRGQGLVVGALGMAGLVTSWLRVQSAPDSYPAQLVARVTSTPTTTRSGGWMVRLDTGRAIVTGFSRDEPPPTGSTVQADVVARPTDHPEVSPVLLTINRMHTLCEADGITAWATSLKQWYRTQCAHYLGPSTEGLIPGMVLGDTTGQTQAEKDMFISTGLSHLTAVSGSNITIITVAAVLVAKTLTLGPRVQVGCAALTLAVFVTVVGPEPSVLRACVMGIVGLLAIIGSAQVEPAHGLALAVIALLLVDSNLATSFGFALSVAATAGLVALSPLIYRALVRGRWASRSPDVLLRALAVAIAADLVTMPIVALMSGRVLIASVLANVLVVAAVAPVTIIGLLAVAVPPLLKLAEPFAWWIAFVARLLADAPQLTIPAPWALLLAGWLVWLIHIRKAHWLLLGALLLISRPGPAPVPLDHVVQLDTIPKDYVAPPGVQAVVVHDHGPPSKRPHRTKEGIPILYPNRDGPVRVYQDGSQRAERGHF